MKKSFFVMLLLSSGILSWAQQNLQIEPAKPQPGSSITIKYNPKNTPFLGVNDFEAVAYLLEGKLPLAQPVQLKKEGDMYVGKIKTNDSTKAVFISFSKDQVRDNNGDDGYYTMLYDKSGAEVPGANMALASGFNNYSGIWGLKRNAAKSGELSKMEFSSAASREKFYNEYYMYLGQSTDVADKELLKQELQKQSEKKNISEADLMKVKAYYENLLKDKESAEKIYSQVKQRFPNGNWKKADQSMAFNKEKNLAEKAKMFDQFIATYPPTKDDQAMIDNMAAGLFRMYTDSADYNNANKYAGYIKNRQVLANSYNSIAWKLAGEGVSNKPLNVSVGKEYSKKSLDLLKEEMKNPSNKQSYVTDKQYAKNLENTYYSFSDTYATLLYHNKEYDKAYDIEKKAVEQFKRKNVDMNEAYAILTEKTKGATAAQAELVSFLEDGKYTPKMKEQLKTLYIAGGNTEEQWNKYQAGLEQAAFVKLKAELAKDMINMPAPNFKLKDVAGNEVSLASLKGKVVVVDFWATWCGPCKASFPGMKLAVEKYKSNPDVVFLFIDTWEGGADKTGREKTVTGYLDKTKYPFTVLYDEAKKENTDEFIVVSNYKVEGIPTKFIIDRNNNIRFKAVGFQGSTDALVNEITAMIDMASSASTDGNAKDVKKAF